MSSFATQIPCKTPNEALNGAVSFDDKLSSSKVLTGAPTATDDSGALTLTSVAISSATLTIGGESVTAGRAVTFNVAGGSAGTIYRIDVKCNDDDTPAQTHEVYSRIQVAPAGWETNRTTRLTTVRDQYEVLLIDLSKQHKPSYTIEGQTMNWQQYQAWLIQAIDKLTMLLERESGDDLFEIVSQGHP